MQLNSIAMVMAPFAVAACSSRSCRPHQKAFHLLQSLVTEMCEITGEHDPEAVRHDRRPATAVERLDRRHAEVSSL